MQQVYLLAVDDPEGGFPNPPHLSDYLDAPAGLLGTVRLIAR